MAKTCDSCGNPIGWKDRFDTRYVAIAGDLCSKCYVKTINSDHYNAHAKLDARALQLDTKERELVLRKIILTTETAHNLPVTNRLGIVTAEYVVGMHIFRDIASATRDLFGGRSQTMQRALKEAREAALTELRSEAHALGADAVVGVDLDYSEISGGGKSMLFLVASGTAVKLEHRQGDGLH